jgi:pyruvate formate lyase activating enzyme
LYSDTLPICSTRITLNRDFEGKSGSRIVKKIAMSDVSEMTEDKTLKRLVFDIKHYAVHDGPGIRTTVFLKGCPLNCPWCSNPESQRTYQEIMFHKNLCIACGECVKICPNEAQTTDMDHKIKREMCERCGKCVEVCYSEALKMVGKYMSVEEIVKEVEKDELFYKNSGGGVTISGGEPLMYPDFTLELLKRCKEKGYHTALETSGYARWEVLERILKCVDWLFYDIKHMNSERHRELTGVPNELILENLTRIDKMDLTYVIRVPLIPTCNDSDENFEAMITFFSTLKNYEYIEILPYHQFGISKYKGLGEEYRLSDVKPPETEYLIQLREKMKHQGLKVIVASLK